MKKNFFKKLSFVLALAMIVSTIMPAAGAFAATKAPKLNSAKQYLYLDAQDGKQEYDFNIANKLTGWKYEWNSSNEDVAVVEDNGLTTAVGIGTAKVSVVITKKGAEVATLSADVVVKDNIRSLTITNTPAGDKLAVNKENDFNRSFVTSSGSTTKTTSITRWTVNSDKATISDSGVFKATEAGDYVITARSFQSTAKYEAWKASKDATLVTATKDYTVKVVPSMTGAKQVDKNTFVVNFDSAMTDVAKNITVSHLVGTTKVKDLVKSVTMDAANKVATVQLYIDLAASTTYVVDYPNMESASFVAATKNAEDVKSMQITTTQATLNTDTAIAVKLFNADNVDITTTELLARVTLSADSTVGTFVNTSAKSVLIFTKGAVATVKATYHTYKYSTTTGTEEGNIEATGAITGVEAAATNVSGLNAWSIGSTDFSNANHTLTVDGSGMLYVQLKTLTGTTEATIDNTAFGDQTKYEFTSSDSSVLIVGTQGNLFPVKEGTAVVVVKYGTGTTKTPIGTVAITITGKRAAANFSLSAYEFALSNSHAVADSKTVTVSVKDQYTTDFAYGTYKVEKLSGPASTLTAVGDGLSGDIVFNGDNALVGTYTYKVTVGSFSKVVVVNVAQPSEATASYYKIELSATSVDLAAKDNETNKNVTVTVFGYATNGVKTTKETLGSTVTVSVDAPYDTVANTDRDTANLTAAYALATGVSGGAMTKLPVGSYKVTATKTVNGAPIPVDVQYFTVTDSQVKPVLSGIDSLVFSSTVADVTAKTAADLIAVAKNCFKVTLNGADQDANIVSVDAVGTPAEIYVKSVTVRQSIKIDATHTTYIDHVVTIDQLVKKN